MSGFFDWRVSEGARCWDSDSFLITEQASPDNNETHIVSDSCSVKLVEKGGNLAYSGDPPISLGVAVPPVGKFLG